MLEKKLDKVVIRSKLDGGEPKTQVNPELEALKPKRIAVGGVHILAAADEDVFENVKKVLRSHNRSIHQAATFEEFKDNAGGYGIVIVDGNNQEFRKRAAFEYICQQKGGLLTFSGDPVPMVYMSSVREPDIAKVARVYDPGKGYGGLRVVVSYMEERFIHN